MKSSSYQARTIASVALVLAVISLILAGAVIAFADEELTLDGLADLVSTLTGRVDAVETRLEEMTPELSASVEAVEKIITNPWWSPEDVWINDGTCLAPPKITTSLFVRGEVTLNTADTPRALRSVSIHPAFANLVASGFSINPADLLLQGIAIDEEGSRVHLSYGKDRSKAVSWLGNCVLIGHSEWEKQ